MKHKIVKKDDMVRWAEISHEPNPVKSRAWMQVCYDYSTDYEYNWDADFLQSEGEKLGTKFNVSTLGEGDIVKVSGHENQRIAKVIENNDEHLIIEDMEKDEAIDELRTNENNLRDIVQRQISKADIDQLEVIHAKLNDMK